MRCDAIAIVIIALSGCVRPASVHCGDRICSTGKVCAPDGVTCATQDAIDACIDAADGDGCGASGVCRDRVCIPAGCGNDLVEPGELCDDGNRTSFDGCRSDCLSLETCGDGIVEAALGEQCDCGDADHVSPACTSANSQEAGAACRESCRPATCGDGVRDPSELCDDGNAIGGDGCRADCAGQLAKMESPVTGNLAAAWTNGPTDAFAVGSNLVLHYDGVAWTIMAAPPGSWSAMWGTGPSNVYAGGNGGLIRYDGAAWTRVMDTQVNSIASIWGSAPDDIYIVGGPGASTAHWNGTVWSPTTMAATCTIPQSNLFAVWGSGATDVLIGGNLGSCRFDGATWTASDQNHHTSVITGRGAADVFGLETQLGSQMRHWNGTAWANFASPAINTFAMTVTSSGDVYAVGESGIVARLDGVAWTSLVSPTERSLRGIAATDSTNVFVVGDFGTILH